MSLKTKQHQRVIAEFSKKAGEAISDVIFYDGFKHFSVLFKSELAAYRFYYYCTTKRDQVGEVEKSKNLNCWVVYVKDK